MPSTQGWPVHDFPHAPQLSGSVAKVVSQPFAGVASQLPKPALHVNPQALAAHVATAFGGTGHTVQAAPQAVGSVGAVHLPPHALLGAAHVIPHVSAMHVAAPPGGTGQAVQAGPQAVGSVVPTHVPAQAWNCALHVNVQIPVVQAFVPFGTGVHLRLQPPQ